MPSRIHSSICSSARTNAQAEPSAAAASVGRTATENEPGSEQNAAVAGRATSRAALIEQLFRDHNDALLRFLASKLHSVQEARDIAQEAYVRMLRLDAPDAVSYLRGFLFKTAANLAIDSIRSRAAERERLKLEFFMEPAKEVDPGRKAAAVEELQLIETCINELPPRCRQAFMLRRLQDVSVQEIAKQMNLPARTVRHYVLQAMVYCSTRLAELHGRLEHHANGAKPRDE